MSFQNIHTYIKHITHISRKKRTLAGQADASGTEAFGALATIAAILVYAPLVVVATVLVRQALVDVWGYIKVFHSSS